MAMDRVVQVRHMLVHIAMNSANTMIDESFLFFIFYFAK